MTSGLEGVRGMKLSPVEIERGWHETFSTNNPFCPCDLRTFTKAVRWAEWELNAKLPTPPADAEQRARELLDAQLDPNDARPFGYVEKADAIAAIVAALTHQPEAKPPVMQFTLGEAIALVEAFGGENTTMCVQEWDASPRSGDEDEPRAGKHAWCADHPEEGATWLGEHDPDTEEFRGFAVTQPEARDVVDGPEGMGRTLYIDLDGVMADFDGSFPAVFGLDHRSLADDDMWLHINGHASFFRDLPPMAGAIDFFRSVEHLRPVILTACPKSNYPHVAAQKRAWVREHLSSTCLVLPVLGGRHKPLFMHQPGDILIDDFGRNCAAWTEAGGVSIKHEGDWAATRETLAAALTEARNAVVECNRDCDCVGECKAGIERGARNVR